MSYPRTIDPRRWITRPLLDAICLLVLCITLSLGLWPFHAPRNGIAWLGFCNGLTIPKTGSAFSTRSLPPQSSATVEIWLAPRTPWQGGTILSLYTPGGPHQFALEQSLTDWEIETEAGRLYLPNVFRKPTPVFLTATFGPAGTTLYVNGALARRAPRFTLPAGAFAGRVILGDSPAQPDAWPGQILGAALYAAELTPAAVQRHYDTWTRALTPAISPEDRNLAFYPFDERAGRIVHDRSPSALDLYIPEKYQVVDKIFLEPFWHEFALTRSYWDSALKNVVGLVPFGFCFYPLLLLHRARRPQLTAVLLGTLTSITIEVFQVFLPTRDSGTTDIFTNTLGTWLGVLAFRFLDGLIERKYQTNLIPKSVTSR